MMDDIDARGAAHRLSMTVLMTPDQANFASNAHGGTVLKLLDQVAYACASRYAGRYGVTLSVDQVMSRQPIHVGELVTFLASVNHTGTSSMEVGIKVVAENIRTQALRHVNSCFFTMISVDDERKPVPVAPLQPRTPDGLRRFDAAKVRRRLREEMRASSKRRGGIERAHMTRRPLSLSGSRHRASVQAAATGSSFDSRGLTHGSHRYCRHARRTLAPERPAGGSEQAHPLRVDAIVNFESPPPSDVAKHQWQRA